MSFLESIAYKPVKGLKQRGYYDYWSSDEQSNFIKGLSDLFGYSIEADYIGFSSLPELNTDIDADNWDNVLKSYYNLAQTRAMFSKDESLKSPIDKERVAYSDFLLSEESCSEVNSAFRESDGKSFRDNAELEIILHYARIECQKVLGDVPDFTDFQLLFGAGASSTCRKITSARWKLDSLPSMSTGMEDLLNVIYPYAQQYFEYHKYQVQITDSVLQFVPKNYKTYRSICMEPTLNGCVQRYIGQIMKRKLFHSGTDLYDQSINRRRAYWASKDATKATIDLSRASDSISYGLVLNILPREWFSILDGSRSGTVTYNNNKIYLQKFSGMGNGYTFELESLIFRCLIQGIAKLFKIVNDTTIYGDDIICNTLLAEKVIEYFPYFGLTPNVEKSYLTGNFRESCGGDYFKGIDVRPYYIKDRISYHTLVCFYNHFVRKNHLDPLSTARRYILSYIPENLRLWGPDGFGDGHLLSNASLSTYAKRHGRNIGYSGYLIRSRVQKPTKNTDPLDGDFLLPSYMAQLIREQGIVLKRIGSQVIPRAVKGTESDPYAIRSSQNQRKKAKIVNIYVLGDHDNCRGLELNPLDI